MKHVQLDLGHHGELIVMDDPNKTQILPGNQEQIGRYRILTTLGQGAMGIVYKACDMKLDRIVALKVLTAKASSSDAQKRFEREAKSNAKLRHPHIVALYDLEYAGDVFFLTMDFIDGCSLEQLMEKKSLSISKICKIMGEILSAVGYAHEQGIVHRDLKPSNILVNKHGECFVTDFGLAKMLNAESKISHAGTLLGTPFYMSPEQARGDEVDTRSDLFSLGVMFYEMMTGRKPFDGDTVLAVLYQIVNESVPNPREINAELPEPISRICLKALAKDQRQRYQHAGEMIGDIRNFLHAKNDLPEKTKTQLARPPDQTKLTLPPSSSVSSVAKKRDGHRQNRVPKGPVARQRSLPAVMAPIGLVTLGMAIALMAVYYLKSPASTVPIQKTAHQTTATNQPLATTTPAPTTTTRTEPTRQPPVEIPRTEPTRQTPVGTPRTEPTRQSPAETLQTEPTRQPPVGTPRTEPTRQPPVETKPIQPNPEKKPIQQPPVAEKKPISSKEPKTLDAAHLSLERAIMFLQQEQHDEFLSLCSQEVMAEDMPSQKNKRNGFLKLLGLFLCFTPLQVIHKKFIKDDQTEVELQTIVGKQPEQQLLCMVYEDSLWKYDGTSTHRLYRKKNWAPVTAENGESYASAIRQLRSLIQVPPQKRWQYVESYCHSSLKPDKFQMLKIGPIMSYLAGKPMPPSYRIKGCNDTVVFSVEIPGNGGKIIMQMENNEWKISKLIGF